jgi:cytochrome b561
MTEFSASPVRYTRIAIYLHWGGAVLIAAASIAGLYMLSLPMSVHRLKWFNWHKWLGIASLLWLAFRLAWRLGHPPPRSPENMDTFQVLVAKGVHLVIYLLMLIVPLLGWAYSSAAGFPVVWLGIVPMPDWVSRNRELAEVLKPVHRLAANALITLIALHIMAAFKHHFLNRDDLLTRMKPW